MPPFPGDLPTACKGSLDIRGGLTTANLSCDEAWDLVRESTDSRDGTTVGFACRSDTVGYEATAVRSTSENRVLQWYIAP